jgi:hypothetical protein
MTDLIIDMETFGQNIFSCPIINCAVAKFDPDRFAADLPYTYDEILNSIKLLKLDVSDQVNRYGYVIEPSSLEFWKKRPPEVRNQIKPQEDDLSIDQFCDELITFIDKEKIKYWWARSNTFDTVLLYRIANDAKRTEDINKILKFWRVRDVRTYIDAKTSFELDMNAFIPIDKAEWTAKFKEHDCRHDITADILRMQRLVRAENGLD